MVWCAGASPAQQPCKLLLCHLFDFLHPQFLWYILTYPHTHYILEIQKVILGFFASALRFSKALLTVHFFGTPAAAFGGTSLRTRSILQTSKWIYETHRVLCEISHVCIRILWAKSCLVLFSLEAMAHILNDARSIAIAGRYQTTHSQRQGTPGFGSDLGAPSAASQPDDPEIGQRLVKQMWATKASQTVPKHVLPWFQKGGRRLVWDFFAALGFLFWGWS